MANHLARRAAGQRLVDRQRRIESRRLVLGKVLHHHLMPGRARARIGCFLARQHSHQRRLASAVWSDQRDPVATLDVQADVAEHGQGAVRLADVLELENVRPSWRTPDRKWIRLRSGGTSIGTTFSSDLMRLWTWAAFVAW